MSKGELRRIVRVWQGRLGADQWELEVDFSEPSRDGTDASTWRSNDYDRATMRFGDGWEKWSVEFANRIAVHELLHLGTREVDRVVDDVTDQMHREAATQIERRYLHEVEGFVDRLACRLVDLVGCA